MDRQVCMAILRWETSSVQRGHFDIYAPIEVLHTTRKLTRVPLKTMGGVDYTNKEEREL